MFLYKLVTRQAYAMDPMLHIEKVNQEPPFMANPLKSIIHSLLYTSVPDILTTETYFFLGSLNRQLLNQN